MTINEMILNNPERSCTSPESIFMVRKPDGGIIPMCFADFAFELHELCEKYPGILQWEVAQEHMTSVEVDALPKQSF